jgi:RimJ/RimL family protein N-acetyltransferase
MPRLLPTCRSRRHPHFIVTLPGANGTQVIGAVGFAEDPDRKGEAELGYWIARKHWRRGYATEAARAALSVARTLVTSGSLPGISSTTRPADVLRKLGFTRTGEAKPCHSLSRGRADPAYHYALELVSPASDPADPNMFRRAA